MLSRSIYNLMSMIRQGGTSAAATGQSLVDVMTHWHTMAIQLESEVEALREGQARVAGSSATRTAGKTGPTLRLVIDNDGGQS